MNTDILTVLREEIAGVMTNVRKCNDAYKGFKAFKNNRTGLSFCAQQLYEAASALLDHAQHVAQIAEDLQTVDHKITNGVAQPEEMLNISNISLDGHRSRE
jgi:hypothetical protein